MKQIFLILVLCISRLIAQVGPPDLRCLEVLSNGDVKLTWVPPSDPSNLFSSYDVYFCNSKAGTYSIVSTGLNAINTTTFVHTTTLSLSQGCYYYMTTRSGSGGTSTSVHSDTLRSIFLNTFPGIITLDVTFSHLHRPKLPGSADLYAVLKEYPLGTWNVLANTAGTEYQDTLNICIAKINYKVTLSDQSGCTSSSNLVVGTYSNTKAPERTYVDSISVLPNGFTVLGWQVPIDKDIDRYIIQYDASGINQNIDVVPGRNSTAYTYTTPTANTNTVGIFVQAVDSCGKSGPVNYELRTMLLKTAYNSCAYQTELNWNRYNWSKVKGVPVESTLEYRIYYSVNGSAFTVVGKTTDTTFIHTNTAPGKNICYFVRVFNKGETISSSSNRACFFSSQVATSSFIYLKTASILDKSSAEIKVYLDNAIKSKGISIERSEDNTDFKTVGFVAFNGDAHYSFTDTKIQSHAKSYYYRAILLDSCGNARGGSNVAKTILLKVQGNEDQIFTKQLSWSEYQGFGGSVSGYNIYRIVNDDMSSALIGSTDALTTFYTDNLESAAPQGAKIEYVVQAVEGIGNPYGIFEMSNSNTAAVYMEGNLYVPNAFAPGGVNKTWRPVTHFIDKSDYNVSVFNRWGKKVFETTDDTKAWDGENCIADIYVYLIHYKNSRGEYMEIKGNVLLLR